MPYFALLIFLSGNGMRFGIDAVQKLNNIPYVELLIHPKLHQLAVRPSKKEVRTAIKWATAANVKYQPRIITGAAFLPTLFELFGWKREYRSAFGLHQFQISYRYRKSLR